MSSSSSKASKSAGLLSLPLEIRLDIYSFAIGLSDVPDAQHIYYSFTLFNAPQDSKLCRSGFRNSHHPTFNRYNEWPIHDTRSLSLTCKQINIDLREDFHPGPLALKIIEDSFFGLCTGNKLSRAITDRPWLQKLEVVRLDLSGWNVYPENLSTSELWLKRRNSQLSQAPDYIRQERTPLSIKLKEWAIGVSGQRLHNAKSVADRSLADDQNRKHTSKKYDFGSFIQQIKMLPRLQKIEIFIRSIDIYEHWADPISCFKAIHNVGIPFFCVVHKGYVPTELCTTLIESRAESLVFLNSNMWPKALLASSYAQIDKRWRLHKEDNFRIAYR